MRLFRHPLLVPLLLFVLAFALFSPALAYRLVDLDDFLYILHNPLATASTPSTALHSAFTTFFEALYAPVLWCSYALDERLFHSSPSAPWGYHLTNVLLHAANASLFAILLSRFCKKRLLVAAAVAFWALHPLRVESVAWVAERKDVLSAFFAFLSAFAWLRFAAPTSRPGRLPAYGLSLALFSVALLSKTSVAPLPLVFLFLDVYPLRRVDFASAPPAFHTLGRRLAELIPFFALSALSSLLATAAHIDQGVLRPVSLAARLASVPVNTTFYLVKTIIPFRLSPLYLDLPLTAFSVLGSLLFLAILGTMAFRLRHRAPAVLLGLLVFAVFLFPASGIVRFGVQSIADRFTYLPSLGLSIAAIALPVSSHLRKPARVVALLGIAFLATATLRILPVWRNTDALYDRVLLCNPAQPRILVAKAKRLLASDSPQKALPLATAACSIPDPYSFVEAHLLRALLLQELENPQDALLVLSAIPRASLNPARLSPIDAELARVFFSLKRFDDALAAARLSLRRLSPGAAPSEFHSLHLLAMAAAHRAGRSGDALSHARAFPPFAGKTALSDADLLPFCLSEWSTQHRALTVPLFRNLLTTSSDSALVNNLVWGLATADRSPIPPDEMLAAATRLAADAPQNPGILDTLAAAQARAGHFADAQATLLKALDLLSSAPPSPDRDLFAAQLRIRLDLYRKNRPCSENAFARWFAAIANQPPQPLPAP